MRLLKSQNHLFSWSHQLSLIISNHFKLDLSSHSLSSHSYMNDLTYLLKQKREYIVLEPEKWKFLSTNILWASYADLGPVDVVQLVRHQVYRFLKISTFLCLHVSMQTKTINYCTLCLHIVGSVLLLVTMVRPFWPIIEQARREFNIEDPTLERRNYKFFSPPHTVSCRVSSHVSSVVTLILTLGM